MYSNTTLVKVKLVLMAILLVLISDSNTTLVKVKFGALYMEQGTGKNSNTTLVKVKLGYPNLSYVDHKALFKYNTC